MSGSGLLAKRPRLRADLIFSRPLRRGPDTVYLIKDRRSARAFEISPKEQFLLRRLDGARSLADIGAEYAAEYGRRLGDEHWTRLLWLLHERDLLSTRPVGTVGDDSDSAPGGPAPLGVLGWWAHRLRWLLRPAVFALLAVLVAALLAVVGLRLGPLWQAARPAFTDPVALLALTLLAWFGAALHEFAHALVAVHVGATVNRINLITLTCEIEDYLYLPRRSQQVMIAVAGAVANGLVLLVVGVALAALPGAFADRLFSAYVLVGAAQTLVNLVPLPPLDGYKIVSHLLGLLNLAPESRRYLTTLSRRLVRRPGPRYPRRTAVQLGLFAGWWLIAFAAVAAVVIGVGGALLRPALGTLSYVPPAAIVGLTIAGWLARPHRHRPADRTPPQPLNRNNQ
ncbi:M50 family metallopeptidase [Micromonospora aurantiaca (nom. illeg.)]|uniref:M50 family metallopeptidase n=1 Tax=Micromonospora aurantiaca (nom. illeg.) TaxID=47850 RepID=UPI003401C11F